MSIRLIGQAIVLFAVTNIDNIVILTLFFGQAIGRHSILRVVIGQYLGFAAILAGSILGALGARLLPEMFIPYLGLLPLVLGARAAWVAWREHRTGHVVDMISADEGPAPARRLNFERPAAGPGVVTVAAVTLANGGDNLSVYIPVFAAARVAELLTYLLVFLALVAVWCAAGHFVARRPLVARAVTRSGHFLLPLVLFSIGLIILIKGHAFGL